MQLYSLPACCSLFEGEDFLPIHLIHFREMLCSAFQLRPAPERATVVTKFKMIALHNKT